MLPHHHFVRRASDHRRGRHRHVWNENAYVIKLRPKIEDYRFSRFWRSARAVDYQIKFGFFDVVERFHKRLYVAAGYGKR